MSDQLPLENIVLLVLEELLDGEIDSPTDRATANCILIRIEEGNKLTDEEAKKLSAIFETTPEYWMGLQEDQTIREDGET